MYRYIDELQSLSNTDFGTPLTSHFFARIARFAHSHRSPTVYRIRTRRELLRRRRSPQDPRVLSYSFVAFYSSLTESSFAR